MTPTLTPMPPDRSRAIRTMLVAEASRTAGSVRNPRAAVVRRSAYALAAALAVVSAAVLITDEPAGPAYGSWTAMPDTGPGMVRPPSEEIGQWASRCTELTGGGVAVQGVPVDPGGAADREILVDRRGDFTFCLDLAAGSGTRSDPLIALAGITGGDEAVTSQAWSTVVDEAVPMPSGDDVLLLADWTESSDGPEDPVQVLTAFGAAGDDVTGVEIRLEDGTRVTATVQAGLWAAWWPSTVSRTDVEALVISTTTGGRTVDPAEVSLDLD